MRKKLRVAGYARVSTDEQKKYGYSIQAQIDEITQWCNDNDHDLIHIYIDEGFSASTMKRPQLQAMLSNLKNLDAIAFTRLERLYAETEDKIKRLESFKPQSTDHLKQFLNSGWQSIYDNLTRENKRTLWRNILDSVHVSPDKIEVFFK